MKKTTFKVVFNRLKKLNKDKKALIQIESYLNGKRKYMSTGIRIEPKYWNDKIKRVKNSHSDYIKLNRLIDQQLRNLEDFEFRQIEKNGEFKLRELGNLNNKNKFSSGNFITFCRETLNGNTLLKKNSRIQHNAVINNLERYKKNIDFNELNFNFITEYDNYLRRSGLKQNTITNQHKTIKSYINLAIKNKLMSADEYPYRWFKIKQVSTKLIFLTLDEIARLEKLKFTEKTKQLEYARDMFVFSCYTGLRYSDVIRLNEKDIIKSKNEWSIMISQEKTQKSVTLPLNHLFKGKPLRIAKKYEKQTSEKTLFPTIYNREMNAYLKIIASIAGIEKHLTFHVSRHTFGTNLAAATSDQFLIKELMGHTDIRTSMIYIHTSEAYIKNKLKNTNWG
jgi:integrase